MRARGSNNAVPSPSPHHGSAAVTALAWPKFPAWACDFPGRSQPLWGAGGGARVWGSGESSQQPRPPLCAPANPKRPPNAENGGRTGGRKGRGQRITRTTWPCPARLSFTERRQHLITRRSHGHRRSAGSRSHGPGGNWKSSVRLLKRWVVVVARMRLFVAIDPGSWE